MILVGADSLAGGAVEQNTSGSNPHHPANGSRGPVHGSRKDVIKDCQFVRCNHNPKSRGAAMILVVCVAAWIVYSQPSSAQQNLRPCFDRGKGPFLQINSRQTDQESISDSDRPCTISEQVSSFSSVLNLCMNLFPNDNSVSAHSKHNGLLTLSSSSAAVSHVTAAIVATTAMLHVALSAQTFFVRRLASPATSAAGTYGTFVTLWTLTWMTQGLGHRTALAAELNPTEELTLDILASNLTSEEKFRRILVAQHQRFCGSAITCLDPNLRLTSCSACMPCQCDAMCADFGDCCPDRLAASVEMVPKPAADLRWSCRDTLYSGYTKEQRLARLLNSTSYFVIDTCPAGAPPTLVASCADRARYHPVSLKKSGSEGQDQNLVVDVFANEQCAQCHGLDAKELVLWKILVSCKKERNFSSTSQQDLAQAASQADDCFVSYIPTPAHKPPRLCHYDDNVVTSCNVTGGWRFPPNVFTWPGFIEFYQRACATYISPKIVDGVTYQNVFCYICNTGDVSSSKLFGRVCPRSITPMPFSALLDFSRALYGGDERATRLCPPDTVYDASVDECRALVCSPGRTFTDEVCWPVFGNAQGLGYTLYLAIRLDRELNLYDENDYLHVLPMLMEDEIVRKTTKDSFKSVEFELSFAVTDVEGRCSQKSQQMALFSKLVALSALRGQEEVEQVLLGLRNLSVYTRFFNFTTRVDEGIWAQQAMPGGEGQVTPTQDAGTNPRACSTKVSKYPQVLPNSSKPLTFTKVHHLLDRPKVQLTRKDRFKIRPEDQRLEVPWLSEPINPDTYELTTDGSYYIAFEDFKPKIEAQSTSAQSPDGAEVVLSIVCTSLSLVSLALTFLTYLVFRQLRTAPGLNNLNLCLTLFLAQFFYLVGSGQTQAPEVCQAMGILIHYFWLAAFAAMSVCSYHMWRAFTCVIISNDNASDQWRRFLAYSAYVWGGAAAVVVVVILTHLVVSQGAHLGYGGARCYLSSVLAIGVAVGIPVALTITASVTFFTLTVRAIRCSPKPNKSKEDERHLWVYLKLCTITGATWALAFIIFFTQLVALRYIFTVINGLQGVFIFVSFICNKRVFKLLQHSSAYKGLHSRLSSASGWTRSSFLRSWSSRSPTTDSSQAQTTGVVWAAEVTPP